MGACLFVCWFDCLSMQSTAICIKNKTIIVITVYKLSTVFFKNLTKCNEKKKKKTVQLFSEVSRLAFYSAAL